MINSNSFYDEVSVLLFFTNQWFMKCRLMWWVLSVHFCLLFQATSLGSNRFGSWCFKSCFIDTFCSCNLVLILFLKLTSFLFLSWLGFSFLLTSWLQFSSTIIKKRLVLECLHDPAFCCIFCFNIDPMPLRHHGALIRTFVDILI